MKYKYILEFTKEFIKSYMFKTIAMIFLIGAFISLTLYSDLTGSLGDSNNYFSRLNHIILNPSMSIFFLGMPLLLAIVYTIKRFNYYDYYFIRLESKKKYHKFCIYTIISNITILYILYLLIIFVTHLIFRQNIFTIVSNQIISDPPNKYYVNNLYYMIWSIFKIYSISIVFTIFNYMLFRIVNNKISIIINCIIFISTYMGGFLVNLNIKFYLLNDFLRNIAFDSFNSELCIFFGNLLLSILTISFLYELFSKYMKVTIE